MSWTDELKAEVVSRYSEKMNTFDEAERGKNSIQTVADIVEQLKESGEYPGAAVNGVRMVLIKAGVYIKKTDSPSTPSSGGASKRVSKAESHAELINLIKAVDETLVDEEVISKLTGKAAQYVSSILTKVL